MLGRMYAVLIMVLFSGSLMAQEQVAVRINENGILKILKMAVQYNTATKESRTVVIPKNLYQFTLPKKSFASNPIIPVVSEISDLNLNRDLNFYLQTSEIKISGSVDSKSIRSKIFNSNANGFDIQLSINLPQVVVNAPSLSLCETKKNGVKSCGNGLKATVSQLKITTVSKPVQLSIVLRLKTDGKVARVSVRSVSSNLDAKSSPNLNINIGSVVVPKISIVINGVESELDTSKLKDEILKKKSFLGKKLLAFAGDFIANDVAEMLNVYLVNKEVVTQYQVERKQNPIKFDEFLRNRTGNPDLTRLYVKTSVSKSKDPVATMMDLIAEVIRNAQIGISLKKISTPENKDIELSGLVNFVLNNRQIVVRNTLGNTNRALPKLDMNAQRNYDINLALSEPLINGSLDLVNSTKLFQEIFQVMSPVKGFTVKNVKMHFDGNKAIVAVVNAQVDLKKIQSKGISDWFKNKIAAWLERNNNNSVIYFPIEVSIVPVFKALTGGGTGIDLKVLSPFNSRGLLNRFRYATNVPDMTDTVREGVMDELRESIEPFTNKTYNVDLSKFLNQSGVVFLPKTISINQGAYLMMNLDIVDIKFNSVKPRI